MKILYRRICLVQFELTLLQRKQKGSVFHINMIFRVQCTSHYKEMQNKIALWGLLWDRVHRPQPSNLIFCKEIRLDRKAYYELLIGLLQRPARDHVCRGQPAYGHLTGLWISVGVPSPMEAAGEKTELDAKPPLDAPLLILHRGDQLKSFPLGDTSARQRGLKSVFSLS